MTTTPTKITGNVDVSKERKMKVIEGVNLLLGLFEAARQKIFPRSIMTANYSGQLTVHNKEEMIKIFEAADFIDCRINAYPVAQNEILYIPNILVIDLDPKRGLKTDSKLLKQSLKKTLDNISEYFNDAIKPLVLLTGNGYHVYIVLDMNEPLENIEEYVSVNLKEKQISVEFMRFAKTFLSDNKADRKNNPSFKSCLLRVPYTLNSKCLNCGNAEQDSEVRIIQNWNNHAPSTHEIAMLLSGFYTHLVNNRISEDRFTSLNDMKNRVKLDSKRNTAAKSINWIETLLRIPLSDHRKYCTWRILTPYLLNVKKLSNEEACSLMNDWLDKCNKMERLSFNPKVKINEALKCASKGYYPIGLEKLKTDNKKLYEEIMTTI
jgi:hypothetical protein